MKYHWVKCSESLGNRVSNIIRRCLDHMKFAAYMGFSFIVSFSCSFGSTVFSLYIWLCVLYASV